MSPDTARFEGILLQLMTDAMACRPMEEQSRIVDRLIAGEDPLALELSGEQVHVYLFGDHIATRSLDWFQMDVDPAQCDHTHP